MTVGDPRGTYGGDLDLGELPELWRRLDEFAKLHAAVTTGWAAYDGLTARAVDERLPAGHRVHMGSERYLSIAMEHHYVLLFLLENYGATPYVPWGLLRSTFESAFYAAWLLEPLDSRTRRRRALRLEWWDEHEHRAHNKLLTEAPLDDSDDVRAATAQYRSRVKEHDQIFSKEAAELGLRFPPPKISVTDELKALNVGAEFSDGLPLRLTWASLSGMLHGRGSTLLRNSSRTNERAVRGGYEAVVTIDDASFEREAAITCRLHYYALFLSVRRHSAG